VRTNKPMLLLTQVQVQVRVVRRSVLEWGRFESS
jgi:hypothetical protein